MSAFIKFEDILTYRGLMLLKRFGNGYPSYSQIEFAQAIIDLICVDDFNKSSKLDELLSCSGQTRESIQRDSKYYRIVSTNNHSEKQILEK